MPTLVVGMSFWHERTRAVADAARVPRAQDMLKHNLRGVPLDCS